MLRGDFALAMIDQFGATLGSTALRLSFRLTGNPAPVKRLFAPLPDVACQGQARDHTRVGAGAPLDHLGTIMDLGLKGKKAIVTGGTKGIGLKIAETLAAEGVDVALCSRNAAEAAATAAKLGESGVTTLGRGVDVSDGPALTAFVIEAGEALGGLDIVVANVSALAFGSTEESWSKGFQTDMMGTVRLVDAAMPFLENSKAGSIVTISSVSGREIDVVWGSYGALKAAIIHYTQGLAFNLAAKNIRANTVSPGNTYFEGGVWHRIENDNPQLFADSLALNPTGRMATPQEIANAAVFIASPAASFITGTNLVVDGALTRGVQL